MTKTKDYKLSLEVDGKHEIVVIPSMDDDINVTAILEVACYLFKKLDAKIVYEPFTNK